VGIQDIFLTSLSIELYKLTVYTISGNALIFAIFYKQYQILIKMQYLITSGLKIQATLKNKLRFAKSRYREGDPI